MCMKKFVTLKCFLSILLFISAIIISTSASAAFSGGDGTISSPYQIANCIQLQEVRQYPSANFVLLQDINCYDTRGWNGGSGFLPIGDTGAFSGVFDGQGHTISGLYMSGSGKVGMFAEVTGTVKNLGLRDAFINAPGTAYVGALVGYLNGGTLSQVFATGEVSGISYIGGLVGWHGSGPITNVYAQVKSSGIYSGGLVGRNDSALITNAYATGNGFTTAEYGLIGNNFGGTATSSFYDGQLMGRSDTNGGSTPKTTAQMKNSTTYTATSTPGLAVAWDFVGTQNNDLGTTDIWDINTSINGGYPYFTWQTFDQTAPTVTSIGVSVPDGGYVAGAVIPVVIAFSEPVIATSTITVTFETGVTDKTCTFTIDHTNIGTCSFTVTTSDVSPDLNATISGSITDRWGNTMTNFTPTVSLAEQRSIVINPTTIGGGGQGGGQGGGGSVDQQVQYLIEHGNIEMAEEIKSQWPQLFGSGDTSTTSTVIAKNVVFKRNLYVGMSGADVKALQQYLNTHGYIVAHTGAGSKGNESQFFGQATKKALMAFQKKNNIVPASGFFGPKTRAMMK